jgi:hypothetical protein
MNATWNPDQVGMLVRAWASGQPAVDIARLVGMTAAAVRGKRLRLGLPRRVQTPLSEEFRDKGAAGVAPKAYQPPIPAPLAGSMPRPWSQREADECCWPVLGFGEETLSCCLPVEGRTRYCAGHLAMLRREPWPAVDPGNVVLFRQRHA